MRVFSKRLSLMGSSQRLLTLPCLIRLGYLEGSGTFTSESRIIIGGVIQVYDSMTRFWDINFFLLQEIDKIDIHLCIRNIFQLNFSILWPMLTVDFKCSHLILHTSLLNDIYICNFCIYFTMLEGKKERDGCLKIPWNALSSTFPKLLYKDHIEWATSAERIPSINKGRILQWVKENQRKIYK